MPGASRQQDPCPLPEDSRIQTIYSQVQRPEKHEGPPPTKHPPCTIYAAATGQPLGTAPPRAPAHPPEPPAAPQSPRQEPTTVYASVTMPTA
ncbi:protein VASP homolog [Pogoniulus pusillus]|uniref:protein VASP homolog n=1 Tax=Pogoniulus pusillus TaxID=488313 RepID=UPI0030B96487